MNYKKLIVSPDNKLVLEDYNLNSGNSEILDLNKTLNDVVTDGELEIFIKENIVDPEKVYLICVKEDFQTNEQRIENIPNVKKVYKIIKKAFKKYPNVFFFVYNTFAKNEVSYNPDLGYDVAEGYEGGSQADHNVDQNQHYDDTISPEFTGTDYNEQIQEETAQYSDSFMHEQGDVSSPSEQQYVEQTEPARQQEDFQTEGVYSNELDAFQDQNSTTEKNDVISQDDESIVFNQQEYLSNDEIVLDANPSNTDINDKDWFNLESSNSVSNELLESNQTASPYEEDVKRFNDIKTSTETRDGYVQEDIEIPESYYDEENEEQISYEDYQEFQNDYELNVHALKSIYDFVWRMLILNNYNLKLNDLLYLSVNNLDAFSIGQSDFVRQIANRSESLFDLILQLDIKLEFNNSLFYIYLAELFTIKSNKIIVNENFLNTLSIWVNKSSKEKFVAQVEQFINYSSIYNKKIIFSYFIELSNFIKGCIPTITPALNLVDIHRILINPSRRVRRDNIFGFMVIKMNEVFANNSVVIESIIADTPENMFSDSKSNYLDNVELNWKTKLSLLYKRLLENVRNYVFSKGNNEIDIFNLYVDIKDLRMYKGEQFGDNPLSVSVVEAFNNGANYLTIGDAFERTPSIVPSQNVSFTNDAYAFSNVTPYHNTTYTTNAVNSNLDSVYVDNKDVVNNFAAVDTGISQPSKPVVRFNVVELENSMTKRIEEYEKKIKENISRIEAERKNLREKMEFLKTL